MRKRNARRRLAAAVLALGLAAGTNFVSAPTAAAATPAPWCVIVTRVPTPWYLVPRYQVRNHCKTAQRVKLVVSLGPDSSCYRLSVGSSFFHRVDDFPSRIDGLVRC